MSEKEYAATAQYCDLGCDKAGASKDMTLSDLEDGGEPAADEANDLDWDSNEGKGEDLLDISLDLDGASETKLKRGFDPKGRRTIELEVSDEVEQDLFLDLRKSRSAWIRITSLGRSKDGWRRLGVDQVVLKRRRQR